MYPLLSWGHSYGRWLFLLSFEYLLIQSNNFSFVLKCRQYKKYMKNNIDNNKGSCRVHRANQREVFRDIRRHVDPPSNVLILSSSIVDFVMPICISVWIVNGAGVPRQLRTHAETSPFLAPVIFLTWSLIPC